MQRAYHHDKMILSDGFAEEKIVSNGNKFLIGNGYVGYRGTLDEFSRKDCVGVNIAGLYDGVKGKWRETVNAFNPFSLHVFDGQTELSVRSDRVVSHEQSLDISKGVFSRKTGYAVDGGSVTLYAERFCSMADRTLLASRLTLVSDCDVTLTISAGIDTDVWELNGPHFEQVVTKTVGNLTEACGVTQENKVPVRVVCSFSQTPSSSSGSILQFEVNLRANQTYTLDRIAHVIVGGEQAQIANTYDQEYNKNAEIWQQLWKNSDVVLRGKNVADAQFALRYSIYHLLILTPQGDYSIAARGLSGQTYKGAVFWDTEMFLLPFYLETNPLAAKRLVEYRIRTLDGAIAKAKEYGYDGAFYAWESQDGYDACSDFNVTDVFTHRPVRTYFRDKQIHISAAVAYGIRKYYKKTRDDELMLNGGLETLLRIAEFYYSYSYYNHTKDRYELLDVLGPDEYHERVNNNAYTNYMAYDCARYAVKTYRKMLKHHPETVVTLMDKFPQSFVSKLTRWANKLYLPKCNDKGILEQFDGYFKLEDVKVDEVRSRLAHPNEYWGGTTGVATATRVLKQADVIMLMVTLPEYFTIEQLKANYDFYLPYTEHGSSLSASVYALAACKIGYTDDAWKWFLTTAEIDLVGGGKQWAGEVYIGGTHPAANGGAWRVATSSEGRLGSCAKLSV